MNYVVDKNETPQQIAAKLGYAGRWQELVLLNNRMGLRPIGRERGTGKMLYTFMVPREGGKYRAGMKLTVPSSWRVAKALVRQSGTVGASGVGDDGLGGDDGGGTDIGGDGFNPDPGGNPIGGTFGGGDATIGGYCVADVQCPDGSTCDGFTCTVKKADTYIDPSAFCGADQVYVDGKCQKLGAGMPGASCVSGQDCLNGLGQCVNGICQHKKDQGGCAANGAACGGDGECCTGSTCNNGVCGAKPGPGPGPKTVCSNVDQTCTGDGSCCEGLECKSGKCAVKAAPDADKSHTWLWATLGVVAGLAVVGTVVYVSKDKKKSTSNAPKQLVA